MNSISDYSSSVELAISSLKLSIDKFPTLYEPIVYGLSAGGKRLRPVLLLMAAEAFGADVEFAIDPAVGIEMFHNFTLLHDDVMDRSATRRGRASVQARYGVDAAILSGDTMLTLATDLISHVQDSKLRSVLDIFNNMAVKVYEGQDADMRFEKAESIDMEDYIRMIADKTGALLGAAAQIGALIGGASDEDARKMYDFGVNVGIAFQIQDDWLDTFGDPSTFGKPIGGDINNGKKTFLYVAALSCEGSDGDALRAAIKLPPSETKVKAVRTLYEKAGVEEAARKEVGAYMKKALNSIKHIGISDENRESFRKLAEKLVGRKK